MHMFIISIVIISSFLLIQRAELKALYVNVDRKFISNQIHLCVDKRKQYKQHIMVL